MVKITINLRSKWIFFTFSLLCGIYVLYQINFITSAIDIKFLDIVFYYFLLAMTALFYWIPFQFTEQFI